MKIIGLSGGIASGKNFVAEIFAKNGAAIFDADKIVHELFEHDKSLILKVAELFPKASINGKINRKILGEIVFVNKEKLQILEGIIHPLLRKKYGDFLQENKSKRTKIILLNIPLLLEKQGYSCDKIIALLVAPSIQKRRFLQRQKKLHSADSIKNIIEKFAKISAQQMNNSQRKSLADYVVNTGISKLETTKQIEKIIKELS